MEEARVGEAVPLANKAYAMVRLVRLVVKVVPLVTRELLEATRW